LYCSALVARVEMSEDEEGEGVTLVLVLRIMAI
jgi:hypothetical protein